MVIGLRRHRFVLASLAGLLLLGACGGSEPSPSASAAAEEQELTVSGASSLTAAFTDIGKAFEAEHPGTTVTFNFAASDALAGQINEGAPVDVFASASPTWMDSVQDEGPGVTGREAFARNKLAILVPKDNPAGIHTVEDLAEPGVKLVLAAEGVPAGDYAREIFQNAGVSDEALTNVVSNEEDVKGVVTKVLSGDADAGVGYVTDVTSDVADQITMIPIPADINVIATYPIAVVSGSQEADLAQSFVDYVLGDAGRQTLAGYGFLPAS
jgi:molybdate transport system substrate-binding protein